MSDGPATARRSAAPEIGPAQRPSVVSVSGETPAAAGAPEAAGAPTVAARSEAAAALSELAAQTPTRRLASAPPDVAASAISPQPATLDASTTADVSAAADRPEAGTPPAAPNRPEAALDADVALPERVVLERQPAPPARPADTNASTTPPVPSAAGSDAIDVAAEVAAEGAEAPEPDAPSTSRLAEGASAQHGDKGEGSPRRDRNAQHQPDAPERLPSGAEPLAKTESAFDSEFMALDPAADPASDVRPADASEPTTRIHAETAATAKAGEPAEAAALRPALAAAWLQKLGEAAPRAVAGAWQAVRLSLGESDGEVTVEARREDEHVRVAIGFTDPQLRSAMAEQVDRLQSALEARYGTSVDLSFTDGRRDEQSASSDPSRTPTPKAASGDTAETTAPAPARGTGSLNEWVG